MPTNQKNSAVSKFPLRLMPSMRKKAEEFSQREGVSLNQFINVALAEKLAYLQHDEWLARRPKRNAANISRALEILNRSTKFAPSPEDELPEGYGSTRGQKSKKASEAKSDRH